ncbi:sodium/hydrogen exchanger 3 [Batrachochytrium salamandrivorans]|nr:sodium/hydrogen exchanger 3 [Batrachochytrium salamandrivorans]
MPEHAVSELREFIWDIGNGTTEAALCDTLHSFYQTLCPLMNILDPDFCADLYHAYKHRCYWGANHSTGEVIFLYVAIVLILCLTTISILKTKEILYIPESAITISCGVVIGSLFVASGQRPNQAHFNADIFFDILLPFIIFESGYNMEKKLFERNFFEIVLLAIFGTFVSFVVILGIMYAGTLAFGGGFSLLDCAMFASLISSTDPVAIVSVFSSLGVDPTLYALVFGESILNDGVSVALYASMKYFYANPDKNLRDDFFLVLGNFVLVFLGSLLLGFVFALFVAWFWKIKGKQVFTHPVLETLVYLLFAVLPYYLADALDWSGVIAIVSNSMALSVYAHGNLSKTCKFHVVFLVECFARMFEAIMFGYLGLQMVINNERMVYNWYLLLGIIAVFISRACSIFPLLGLRNRLERFWRPQCAQHDAIPFKHQVVIWFSGFRGALAFALAVTIPQYDQVVKQGSKHSGEILAMTCFVIVLNVFAMGSMAPWFLQRMKVVKQPTSNGGGGGGLIVSDADLGTPAAPNSRDSSGLDMFRSFHRKVLKPFFTVSTDGGDSELEENREAPLAFNTRMAVDNDGFVVIDHHNELVDVTPRMAFSQRNEVVTGPPAPVIPLPSSANVRRPHNSNSYSLMRDGS